ncbi:putative Histidine kinase [Candidatus Methanoperedens nitroreducens]|uniref:histidine kinase n=2 Tax=Candidatus Methanoperedens nitratireducens TaxID=1392998 RepID=A0A284VM19_9EURY|nr:putative Histidine kinase [Candidatus Methanoperedens nitroreducens]
MLTDFFIRNLYFGFFIYGLAFLILGITIFIQLRTTEKSEYKLLNILWLLAFFGITHGIFEFIQMFTAVKEELIFLKILGPTFLIISYLFLFLFGYQLINISRRKKLSIWFPSIIVILFFLLLIYLGGKSFWNNNVLLDILVRYFLGFPGGILIAIGFLLYYQSESEKLRSIRVKKYFICAALLFGVYGVLGGLIVPRDSFFPASAVNYTSFISRFGIPVLIFRAMTAMGIALSLWYIMNIFNIEEAAGRKRAKEKIRNQAALLDKANDAIIVRDLEHRIIYWNKSAARLYGFTKDEAIGKNTALLLYKEESPALIQARKVVIEKGEWTGELRQRTKEGKEIIVESHWTLVCDSDGKPNSILLINTDVTEKKKLLSDIEERKRAEEALRIFAVALEEAPDGVQIVDLDGYVIYSNKAVEKIYGFSPKEFKGKHLNEMNSDPEFAGEVIIPGIKERGCWVGELMVKHKDGRELPILLTTSMIKDRKGEPMAFVGIIRDITYLKEKENLQKQLLQAEKLATIGELAAGTAHQINNPLGNISLYAQMLLKNTKDDDTKAKLTIIDDEVNKAASIVKGLLDFARQSEPKLSRIDINKEIEKVLSILNPQLNDIKVTTDLVPLPPILADSGQIQQVIMNLLRNSIQSIEKNGEIMIRTTSKQDHIEISISDNGCGIPEENLDKIFDPFFTTKEQGKGTGLGLSVCYGIIKRHNGSIEVKSETGNGTMFTVKLPV